MKHSRKTLLRSASYHQLWGRNTPAGSTSSKLPDDTLAGGSGPGTTSHRTYCPGLDEMGGSNPAHPSTSVIGAHFGSPTVIGCGSSVGRAGVAGGVWFRIIIYFGTHDVRRSGDVETLIHLSVTQRDDVSTTWHLSFFSMHLPVDVPTAYSRNVSEIPYPAQDQLARGNLKSN